MLLQARGPSGCRTLSARRSPAARQCRVVVVRAAEAPASAAPKDPFAEKNTYNENFLDKLFIKLYSQKMAAQLGGVSVPPEPSYDDFVRVSAEIMKGRNTEQQRAVVRQVLMSLLPPGAPEQFRKIFPPNQMSCEINAWISAVGFYWLVGECEIHEADVVVGENGETRRQKSLVKIKKCRYLENSGCVGMCVNMCKIPTQTFFTDEFGLPLTMKPNFEDLSCEMIFGQRPPALAEDPVYSQPCFAAQCTITGGKLPQATTPCPKLDTERGKAR